MVSHRAGLRDRQPTVREGDDLSRGRLLPLQKKIHVSSNIAWDDRHIVGDSLDDLRYFMSDSCDRALKVSYGPYGVRNGRMN